MNQFKRLPPNDQAAEESVLSALFINNAGFEDVDGLKSVDFYNRKNGVIYQAMLDLLRKHIPVDLVTVAKELYSTKKIEQIGGPEYLEKISDTAPVAVNVKHYANIIKNHAAVRALINTASNIIESGFTVTDTEDYISKCQAEILKIQTTASKDRFFTMEDLMNETLDRIELAQKTDKESGLKFGMSVLDNYIHVCGSKLILLAGRPGMGKTALAMSIARTLAVSGHKVGFLSIEMDKESIADRFLSGESNINSLFFYSKGSLDQRDYQALTDASGFLAGLPILVDDAECQIEDVKRKCRKMKRMGVEIIFIDQLSKIRGKAGASKFDQYSDNCSEIALLKKELRMPIMLLCQLNREVEKRQDKKPTLSDLKQTGMLEEDADMVFLLFRPGYYEALENPGGNIDQSATQIILAKNRQGEKGVENNVVFNAKRGMFRMCQ